MAEGVGSEEVEEGVWAVSTNTREERHSDREDQVMSGVWSCEGVRSVGRNGEPIP